MKLAPITFPISDLNWHKLSQKYFVSVTWGVPSYSLLPKSVSIHEVREIRKLGSPHKSDRGHFGLEP